MYLRAYWDRKMKGLKIEISYQDLMKVPMEETHEQVTIY